MGERPWYYPIVHVAILMHKDPREVMTWSWEWINRIYVVEHAEAYAANQRQSGPESMF